MVLRPRRRTQRDTLPSEQPVAFAVGRSLLDRIAGAPISWGVCEVPGWGVQLSQGRVLDELLAVGLRATELGPDGFLPAAPRTTRSLLDARGITCVSGFVPATLHVPSMLDRELGHVLVVARRLATLGAQSLVLAVTWPDDAGYDAHLALDEAGWSCLREALQRVEATAREHGLQLAVHPHVGTAIERDREVQRLLAETDVSLCLDTGHLSIGGVDVVELATSHVARIAHVHLKDVHSPLAAPVREGELDYGHAVRLGLYRPLGQGDVLVGAVVQALETGGYDGWYVLEQDVRLASVPPRGGGPIADVHASAAFLRGLVDGAA